MLAAVFITMIWLEYSTEPTITVYTSNNKMNKTQTDLYRTMLLRYRCKFGCYYSVFFSSSFQIRGFHSSVRELCHETQSVGLAVLTPYSLWDGGFHWLPPLGKTSFSLHKIQQRSNQSCPWFTADIQTIFNRNYMHDVDHLQPKVRGEGFERYYRNSST